MKCFKLKCFLSLGLLAVFVGGLIIWWAFQKVESRSPASFGELKVIPKLDVYERQEAIHLRFPEGYNICDDREEVLLVLKAINVAVSSEKETQIQIQVSSDCERPFDDPVFYNRFCKQGLTSEDYNGVMYKMIDGMGFFPKEWKVKKLLIGSSKVSMDNQIVLKNYTFSCLN